MDEEVIQSANEEGSAGQPNGDVMQFAAHQLFVLAHFNANVTEDGAPDR